MSRRERAHAAVPARSLLRTAALLLIGTALASGTGLPASPARAAELVWIAGLLAKPNPLHDYWDESLPPIGNPNWNLLRTPAHGDSLRYVNGLGSELSENNVASSLTLSRITFDTGRLPTTIFIDPIINPGSSIVLTGDGGPSNLGIVNNSVSTMELNLDIGLPGSVGWQNIGPVFAAGNLFGPGGIVKRGSGTLTLTGSNTYTGGNAVVEGALSGTTDSIRNNTIVSAGANLAFHQTTTGTYAGNVSGAGSLTKSGAGTVILTGINTYTGGTMVDAGGTLQGNSDSIQGNIDSSGTVSFNQAVSGTYAGNLSGSSGILHKSNSGTLTLTGNNTHGGGTVLAGGVVEVSSNANLGTAGGPLTLDSAILRTTGTFTMDRRTVLGGGDGFFETGSGQTLTSNGRIEGDGTLIKIGAGTLVLGSAVSHTYAGGTNINAGTLRLGAGNQLPDGGAVTVAAGATFNVNGHSETIGSLAGSGSVTLGSGQLTVGANNASSTFGGVIGGTGALTKVGIGTLTLAGANTYAGATSINSGTLRLGASHRLADSTVVVVAAGAIFDVNGHSETIGALAGGGLVTLGSGHLTVGSNSASTIFSGAFSGAIGGTGSLTKFGPGTILALAGSNTYTGGTNIVSGTLRLDASERLADSGAVTMAAGATFNVNFQSETIGSLAGSGLVTLGSGQLTVGANNASTTFGGVISGTSAGTGALTKVGTGTLALAGANTYAGGTHINAGTLRLDAGERLADSGAVTVAAGASFDVNGQSETIGSLAGSGFVALGAGQLTVGANNASTTFGGAIVGSGALTKAGTGTLALAGASTYTGGTHINAGTLRLGAGERLADGGAVTVAAGATFDVAGHHETIGSLAGSGLVTLGGGLLTVGANTTSTTFGGAISGTGALTKIGTGTLTLAGANTYTGGTSINAGTLRLGASHRLADSGAVTVAAGGSFDVNGQSETIGSLAGSGSVTLGSGQLTVGVNTTSTTFGGVISGTGALAKAGAGTLTLAGANTYTGGTSINAGTLRLDASERLADGGAVTVAAGAIFDVNDRFEIIGSLAGSGSVALGDGLLTVGASTTSTTFGGVISGTGALAKVGTGTLALAGANTYTGGTSINAGTLRLDASERLADGGAVTVAAGATFDVNGQSETIGSLAGSGLVTLGGGLLTVGASTTSTTFGGVISGTGALAKVGTGTLALAGANTYTGGTSIGSGTLRLDASERLGDGGAVTVAAGAIFDVNGQSETIGSLAGSGSVTLGDGVLTVGRNHTSTTFSGVITGGGSLSKTGDGTLLLAGSASHGGATNVLAGTLRLGGSERLADSSTVTLSAGSTLDLSNFVETVGALAGAGRVNIGSGSLVAGGNNANTSFSGIISGSGGLIKAGTGTLVLQNTSNNYGQTQIQVGTLRIGVSESIGNTSAVTISAGATLDLNNSNETVSALIGAGSVTLGTGQLTVGGATSTLFSGVISGSGGLTKTGSGTLTLAGANTYTGTTHVNQGTLALAEGGSLANLAGVVVAAGAVFDLSALGTPIAADFANDGSVAGGTGADVLELSGDITGAGDFTGNVLFSGSYSPGNSPALVSHGNTAFAASNTLLMELGGRSRGTAYDAIDAVTLDLDGTLKVSLTDLLGGPNPFAPRGGEFFDLLGADSIIGMFSTFDFTEATLEAGLSWGWDVIEIADRDYFRLFVVGGEGTGTAPAPGTLLLLGAGWLLMVLARRRGRPRP